MDKRLRLNGNDLSFRTDHSAECNGMSSDIRTDIQDCHARPDKMVQRIEFIFGPFTVARKGQTNAGVIGEMKKLSVAALVKTKHDLLTILNLL